MPVKTRRPLGQHFLLNPRFLRYIARRLDVQPGQTVLEIGAGPGNLTRALAATGAQVLAVERDERFREAHRRLAAEFPRAAFVYDDIVRWAWEGTLPSSYKVAGNLPFGVSSQVLIRLLQVEPPPRRAVLLLQRELAKRVASLPGSRAYGALSVLVQTRYKVELLKVLPPGAFTPPPRVFAGLIELIPIAPPLEEDYLRFVRRLFQERRKKLGNAMPQIRADESLRALYGNVRAESLHWQQVRDLYEHLREG